MVRRGAAQSLAALVSDIKNGDGGHSEPVEQYIMPILTALLKDDNDSVKISAVSSAVVVAENLKNKQKVKEEIFPTFIESIEKKVSWRLRFSIAEKAV